MQRREFLRLSVLAPLAAFDARAVFSREKNLVQKQRTPDGRPHRFELSARQFLLDGEPFWIRSGEMHPIRIPNRCWTHRIRMARAMGLNTISIYLMWNALESEPGVFDLTTGRKDFARFIRLCQSEGMWVYLRPGPYICGEWDFGGLPPYLLRHPDIRVRDRNDADYMAAVRRYIATIAPVIAPLLTENGGPILMLQVENEYASFGRDLGYLEELRALWQQHGIDGPFSISDGLPQIRDAKTYLPRAAFGLDGDTDFAAGRDIAGEMPVWMGEGYPGWLTHWGDTDFARGDFTGTLQKLLRERRSFNLYVVHGGTNFEFGAGANAHDDGSNFQPVITSYDYGAPIDERGAATPDYRTFRRMISTSMAQKLPDIPSTPPTADFAPFVPQPFASLWDNLPEAKHVDRPQANELLFGQDRGLVLYRKSLRGGGELDLSQVHDYATVFVDGHYVSYVSRVRHPSLPASQLVALAAIDGDRESLLEILIDSFGHVGYGHAIDRKGIVGPVELGGRALEQWEVIGLPLDNAWLAKLRPLRDETARPGLFFRGAFELQQPGDCYLDMSGWNKGYLWVNGKLLGRYWHIGPQRRLYCPGPWLRAGSNELQVFDLHRTSAATIRAAPTLHE